MILPDSHCQRPPGGDAGKERNPAVVITVKSSGRGGFADAG
jgi:hypothetical protein